MNSMRTGGFAALAGLLLACTGNVSGNATHPGPGNQAQGTGATGSGATGSGATGSGAMGSGAKGSGATGSGATGSGATGSGATGSGGMGTGGSTMGSGGSTDTGGTSGTQPVGPMEPVELRAQLRKVKAVLTGLAPTEDEVQSVVTAPDPDAALKTLIDTWTDPSNQNFYPFFKDKFITFFTNAFEQIGFAPTEDFKGQLLQYGGFDLNPLYIYGDDAFPKLVQNLQESFARTAFDIMEKAQPFSNVLTTRTYMMTTALMSLYIQIENPNDAPLGAGSFGNKNIFTWQVDMTQVGSKGSPTDADRTANAFPMDGSATDPVKTLIFDDRPPAMGDNGAFGNFGGTCTPEIKSEPGYAILFQRLFGFTPRTPVSANIQCIEHESLPYYTASDLSDWRPVTITQGKMAPQMYDLPTLRQTTTFGLALPRVSFFTTPAYMATFTTNDSNKHRVTANQTLLTALGEGLTSQNSITPVSTVGLEPDHSPDTNPECYGCHKILDPMKQFWESYYDFTDRNDFPKATFGTTTVQPDRTNGGSLAFGDVNAQGVTLDDLGKLLGEVNDTVADPNAPPMDASLQTLNRFALAFTQKVCYYADSASCTESDPEFRRVVKVFIDSNYNFKTMLRELMSSPLVTGKSDTYTFQQRDVVVSVARKDQFCQELSNRLGIADVCGLHVAFPFSNGFSQSNTTYTTAKAMNRLAGAMPADGFSRGSEVPVTLADPTLFYRAATELVCEQVAAQVVDATGSPFMSNNLMASFDTMVQKIIGYASGDAKYAGAMQILQDHYNEALSGHNATQALQSTFSLACQSPTSVSIGL
jgi:hypothetical protein